MTVFSFILKPALILFYLQVFNEIYNCANVASSLLLLVLALGNFFLFLKQKIHLRDKIWVSGGHEKKQCSFMPYQKRVFRRCFDQQKSFRDKFIEFQEANFEENVLFIIHFCLGYTASISWLFISVIVNTASDMILFKHKLLNERFIHCSFLSW